MGRLLTLLIVSTLIFVCVAPPPRKRDKEEPKKEEPKAEEKKEGDDTVSKADQTKHEQQDSEYFRYLTQVVSELEKDEEFKAKLHNASEDDIRSGKIAEGLNFVSHDIRTKLDEIKRQEVEYQKDLIRQKKDHMTGVDRNYWNPLHHDNMDTFEMEDMKKLLSKHNDMMNEQDKKRKDEFKEYELEKEHKHKEARKAMTDEEKKKDDQKLQENKTKKEKHEKVHEPGHKAQLEEVWEKEDGLDPDSFDAKTFFNLHDKNSDGFLDQYEVETFFLNDLDKVYNESDPDTDPRERQEEMERMREHVLKEMDKDEDGLLSLEEFMAETNERKEDWEKDEDYKPITDEDQFTDDELAEYERLLEEESKNNEHHDGEAPPLPEAEHHEGGEAPPAEHHEQKDEPKHL